MKPRSSLQKALLGAANATENLLDRLTHGYHERTGWKIPIRVLPYRGYGTPTRFCVRARIVRDRFVGDPGEPETLPATLWTSFKRYAVQEIGGARVRVRAFGEERHAVADREGFVECWFEPKVPVARPGLLHDAEIELVWPPSRTGSWRATARVLIAPPTVEFGVITDIDDTIVQMGARHPLKKARAMFLSRPSERLPFEGAAAFYAALQAGSSGRADNPVFFVSSSPWNLYEHLVEFFRLHAVPEGPIFLRDWGVNEHGFAPDGTHTHKTDPIQRLFAAFPELGFLLVGDSGQHDAEIYLDVVRANPGRVRAIYIRDVVRSESRATELRAIGEQLERLGVQFVLAKDTADAAEHAAAHGYIARAQVPVVEEARDQDLANAGPLEKPIEQLGDALAAKVGEKLGE